MAPSDLATLVEIIKLVKEFGALAVLGVSLYLTHRALMFLAGKLAQKKNEDSE